MVQDGIGVVSLVGDHGLGPVFTEQGYSLGAVMGLTVGQHEADWQAGLIGEQMDFGRQTSSAPPRALS